MRWQVSVCVVMLAAMCWGGARARAEGFVLPNDACVLFVGDTLVEGGSFPELVEEFVRLAYPEHGARFYRIGRAGVTPASISVMFDEGISKMDPSPTHVVVLVGLTTVNMRAINDDELTSFRTDLDTMVRKIGGRGAKVVLVTPPSADLNRNVRLESLDFNRATLAPIAETIREVAKARGAGLVDWYEVSLKQREVRQAQDGKFSFSRDGLRPQSEGNALLSALLLEHWGAEPLVGTIALDWETGETTSDLGQVEASRVSEREIRLSLTDFPLPWVMPRGRGDARSGEWYASRFCEFHLKVSGLSEQEVLVEWEGLSERVSREDLESGYNLALNAAVMDSPACRRLLHLISTKNRLFTTRWIDQVEKKPADAELNEAFETLLRAYDLYHAGYVELIGKTSRRLNAEVILRSVAASSGRTALQKAAEPG